MLIMHGIVYRSLMMWDIVSYVFFFQAEDGIRDLVRSRGLGDVYKSQLQRLPGLQEQLPLKIQL